MNRRTPITSGFAFSAASALPQLADSRLFAQGVRAYSASAPPISSAALNFVISTVVTAYQKSQAGTLNSSTLQAVATAVEGWFGNLAETGWNDWFNQQLKAAESNFLTSTVNPYINSQVQALAAKGIYLTSQQVQSLYQAAANQIQQTASQIVSSGIAAFEANLLSSLSSATPNVKQQTGVPANHSIGVQPLAFRVNCAYLAVAADGIGLGAAVFGFGPAALGFGAVGFVLGAFAYVGWC